MVCFRGGLLSGFLFTEDYGYVFLPEVDVDGVVDTLACEAWLHVPGWLVTLLPRHLFDQFIPEGS